jgi:hypothetical protein
LDCHQPATSSKISITVIDCDAGEADDTRPAQGAVALSRIKGGYLICSDRAVGASPWHLIYFEKQSLPVLRVPTASTHIGCRVV